MSKPDGSATCHPTDLMVEYSRSPIGIDSLAPRFSYSLESERRGVVQTEYRLTVQDQLAQEIVWTGHEATNSTTNIPYAGEPLKPDREYVWRIEVNCTEGGTTPTAPGVDNSAFSTGIQYPRGWDGAEFIGATGNPAHQLLTTDFTIPAGKTVIRAVAYTAGLGYYKLHIDGQQVSTHELGSFTTYEKRVLYETYDCSKALLPGQTHRVAVEVGPGWYGQHSVNVGDNGVMLKLSLTYSDLTTDSIVTRAPANSTLSRSPHNPKQPQSSVTTLATDWKAATGPIVMSDMYAGETFDSRQAIADWTTVGGGSSAFSNDSVVAVTAPSADVEVTSHSVMPTIGVRQSYSACDMWESSPGVFVFDFCQNMAGYTLLHVPEGMATPQYAGQNISIFHAEAIHGPPPSPIFHHYTNTKELNAYIMDGSGQQIEYKPSFVYMGFRYAQLTGYPGTPTLETLSAVFLNTMYDLIGGVSFSDPNLNGVQAITQTAAMSNFQSIPTDCPQRERRGWLGDAQLSSETNMYNFGMAGAYSNFVTLIDDALDPATNATQDCVPWYGHGHQPADPAWGSAFTFLANHVAEFYHDDRIFGSHYAGIKGHLDSLVKEAASDGMDGLLTFDWWGDWCPPSGCRPDKDHHNTALVASFEYIQQLRMVSKYAGILGNPADASYYAALAESASAAFVKHFFDAKNNVFAEPGRPAGAEELSLQTCISLANTLKVIPENASAAVFDNLVNDVMNVHGGHLNVGIVGVKELLPALSDGGRIDVALQVAQVQDEPGWVYMFLQGATTLWETWTGSRYQPSASWNHIMFGSQSAWYYKYLAGLRMAEGSRGWESVEFRPHVWAGAASPTRSICANLSFVQAEVVTIRGEVSAQWTCPTLDVCQEVPEQQNATFTCPPGAVVDSVLFASFGTATGHCASDDFQINASCHSNKTTAVLEAACKGKNECVVPVQDTAFGDPCFDVKKMLKAKLACKPSGASKVTRFTYSIGVPTGSTGSVVLPTFGAAIADVDIAEAGTLVFTKGAFVSGVTGVQAAAAETDATGQNVRVAVTSGAYDFTVCV